MKKTILHDRHISLNARMSPFGGYEMPIQYTGVIAEHAAARSGAAIFDTCHMGEFIIHGRDAADNLERILSCDVADIKVGACRYGFICDENGGVIDDQILYRLYDEMFMMVVNASTEANDFEWIASRISGNTRLVNMSPDTAKIDLQGPASPKIAASLLREPIDDLKFYRFGRNHYRDMRVIVSRTGYTGEIGFEIYCDNSVAAAFWDDCIERGAVPAGLGARDILRLEMGFPLYGHELSINRNAAQSGFSRAISTKKDFIGSAKILDPAATDQLLIGISLDGRRSARDGDIIRDMDDRDIGVITSGAFSPALAHAVALGYIDKDFSSIDTPVKIVSGKNELSGKIAETPFYKKATARADIKLHL